MYQLYPCQIHLSTGIHYSLQQPVILDSTQYFCPHKVVIIIPLRVNCQSIKKLETTSGTGQKWQVFGICEVSIVSLIPSTTAFIGA